MQRNMNKPPSLSHPTRGLDFFYKCESGFYECLCLGKKLKTFFEAIEGQIQWLGNWNKYSIEETIFPFFLKSGEQNVHNYVSK